MSSPAPTMPLSLGGMVNALPVPASVSRTGSNSAALPLTLQQQPSRRTLSRGNSARATPLAFPRDLSDSDTEDEADGQVAIRAPLSLAATIAAPLNGANKQQKSARTVVDLTSDDDTPAPVAASSSKRRGHSRQASSASASAAAVALAAGALLPAQPTKPGQWLNSELRADVQPQRALSSSGAAAPKEDWRSKFGKK
jgi:hypothetical protein